MKARMLTNVATLLCAIVILLTGTQAADQTDKSQSSTKEAIARTKKVEITGTYIPFQIRRTGRITNGALNLVVIDRQEIEHSGAADVAQLLLRDPSIRIR